MGAGSGSASVNRLTELVEVVMPGLDPGIHVLGQEKKDVDGRDKPGHDGVRN